MGYVVVNADLDDMDNQYPWGRDYDFLPGFLENVHTCVESLFNVDYFLSKG
jgi:hypothetical protein